MKGLNGVILVESIHYFPFILINLSAALLNIDRSDRKSTRLNSSHVVISYAVFCLKKKKTLNLNNAYLILPPQLSSHPLTPSHISVC